MKLYCCTDYFHYYDDNWEHNAVAVVVVELNSNWPSLLDFVVAVAVEKHLNQPRVHSIES